MEEVSSDSQANLTSVSKVDIISALERDKEAELHIQLRFECAGSSYGILLGMQIDNMITSRGFQSLPLVVFTHCGLRSL